MKRPMRLPAALLVLGLMISACGSDDPPTGTQDPETGTAAEGGDDDQSDGGSASGGDWDAVYAEIEGLEGQERTDRLIELAQENGNLVRFYSSMNGDEGFALIEEFTEQTGIDVEFYRASARNVTQRLVQEADAGYENSADAISANGTDMVVLNGEGVLGPFESPIKEEYPDVAIGSDGAWVWTYVNYYTPVWNTELVSEDEAPTTWMEALENFGDGRCVLEAKSYDWLSALVKHLGETEGLSEDEAMDVIKDAASGCRGAVSGNSLVTNLVASGEYDIVLGSYHISARHRQAEGAPIGWFDPPATIFGRANGAGVNQNAPNPAGGLLFAEYMLSAEGAQVIAEFDRTVAHPDVEEGAIDDGFEVVPVDLEDVIDNQDKWVERYDELNSLTAGGCVEGC